MSNIVPFSEIENMGLVAAKSKLFGFKTPEEAMSIMLLCQAENLHPAVAMRDYHVIQGRPALKADAMLARFQQAGGTVNWKVYTDQEVTGLFSHPQGGSLEVTWTIEQARSIGIANKDNWRNYPRAMLRARVLSEGIRAVYPGCVVGIYTPEEVQDFTQPASPAKPVDMGMVEEVIHDGAIALYVPGNMQPYKRFHTHDDWINGYADLIVRIQTSSKIKEEDKELKLQNLSEVNKTVYDTLDKFQKLKLKGEIAKNGGKVIPKMFVSLEEDSQESEV